MRDTWMLATQINLVDSFNKGIGCCNRVESLPDIDAKEVSLSSNADFNAVMTHFREYWKRKLDRVTYHQFDCEITKVGSTFRHDVMMQKSYQN